MDNPITMNKPNTYEERINTLSELIQNSIYDTTESIRHLLNIRDFLEHLLTEKDDKLLTELEGVVYEKNKKPHQLGQ